MIDFIKRLFGVSDKPVEAAPANITAPYKVPEPAPTTKIPLVVDMLPAGTEASIAAPAKPKAAAKPKAPAKTAAKAPAKTAKSKAPAKPKVTVAK